MRCIVGLGNPGNQYSYNRHNIGFMLIDQIADYFNATFKSDKKHQSIYASSTVIGEKVFFLKPQTYMNRSGFSVRSISQFYNIDIDNIYVVHDDLDLDKFRIKVKLGGGAGGHNGLKSIDQHIGKNYHRVRFGIGRPPLNAEVTNWVLGNFLKEDQDKINAISRQFIDNLEFLFKGDKNTFVQQLNK